MAAAARLSRFLELGVTDGTSGYDPLALRLAGAMMLGRAQAALGRPDQAAAAYGLAAATQPDNPEPQLALAGLALEQGRNREARLILGRCLELAPGLRRAEIMLERTASRA